MPNTNFNAYVMITKHNLAFFLSFHVTHNTVMVGMGWSEVWNYYIPHKKYLKVFWLLANNIPNSFEFIWPKFEVFPYPLLIITLLPELT